MTSTAAFLLANRPSVAARYGLKVLACELARHRGLRPTVTYATHRTGSTAVHRAIRGSSRAAVKAHALAPAHLSPRRRDRFRGLRAEDGVPIGFHVGDWVVRRAIVEPRCAADFVVLLREPVAVAASLFAGGREWWAPGLAASLDEPRMLDDEAVHLAADSLESRVPSTLIRDWLRHDLAPTLGLDLLEVTFDRDRGFAAIERGPWRIALLRSDLSDERKQQELSTFLRRVVPRPATMNATAQAAPWVRRAMQLARRALASRPALVDRLLDEPFVEHLWSPAEVASLRRAWRGTGGTIAPSEAMMTAT